MVDRMDTEEQERQGTVRSFADDLPGPSPLAAFAQIAESAEQSATVRGEGVEERLERFPELRGIEVPGGNAGAQVPLQAAQQQVAAGAQEDGVSRAVGKGLVNGFVGGLDTGAGVGDRFERFPELRGVSLGTGFPARFPELLEEAKEDDPQQTAEDRDRGR